VPLHLSAFRPDYKLKDIPSTPARTLMQAREIALNAGLRYVYTGNVHHLEGGTTYCPACSEELIVSDWHEIKQFRLTADGRCYSCDTMTAGRFGQFIGQFGRQRIPVRIEAMA
jgi:pyruvate formate lyase activating enzyme